MACLVNLRIINRKYVKLARELNEPVDNFSMRDDYYVNVPCRRCVNCIKSYMNSWRNRLLYEWEYMSKEARQNSYFITLTFSQKHIKLANKDVYSFKRKFIDRIRKSVGKSPRYWLVTEYGERSGRLHLHGLIFDCNFQIDDLDKYWKYGRVDYSQMNENCIKYCTSYITKGNEDVIIPPDKIQRVFTSPGMGKAYCTDAYNVRYHHPSNGVLNPLMQNSSQFLVAMPRYYRDKIFTDDEREDMSLQFFDDLSDDLIPDPPYMIGKRSFTDYTLYLRAVRKYQKQYKSIYRKPKKSQFNGK